MSAHDAGRFDGMGETSVGEVERNLRTYYDQEAADRVGRPLERRRVEARSRFTTLIRPFLGPVLEVGVGAGRDAVGFVADGRPVVGIDLSLEQCRHAAAQGAQPVVGSVRELPLRDGSVGALWSMSTLMHVPDLAISAALGEVRRILLPGALAAIGVWGGPDVEHLGDRDTIEPPRLFCRRSDERWRTMLADLGSVEEFETWPTGDRGFWYQWALVRRT